MNLTHHSTSFNLTKDKLFSSPKIRFEFPARGDAAFPETLIISRNRYHLSDCVFYQVDLTDEIRILEFTNVRSHFGENDDATFQAFQRFTKASTQESNMKGHINVLFQLAFGQESVTELGTGMGVSTAAFVAARPRVLSCYDFQRTSAIDEIQISSGPTEFRFFEQNTLESTIEPTDVLLIDSTHTYDQVKRELKLHAKQVRKYIIFHDIGPFGIVAWTSWSENDGKPVIWTENGTPCTVKGIRPAIYEFLRHEPDWYIVDERIFCSGLMIIGRR